MTSLSGCLWNIHGVLPIALYHLHFKIIWLFSFPLFILFIYLSILIVVVKISKIILKTENRGWGYLLCSLYYRKCFQIFPFSMMLSKHIMHKLTMNFFVYLINSELLSERILKYWQYLHEWFFSVEMIL